MSLKRNYLYFSVFISGMTSLAAEMAASRLLGNTFGGSNLVWASIIGLILIYLTLGYFIGGRWADRSPHPLTFYAILAWAGFSLGLVPAIAHPVLRFAADAFDQLQLGILFGSFLAVVILFVVPITLMGTASPFAIRLAILDPAEAGRVSGRIYAISTLGSFLGTFLPVLVFIPTIGTFRTFLVFAGLLLLTGLVGIVREGGWRRLLRFAWMPLALAGLAYLGLRGPDKASLGQIFETESPYNYIQVLQQDGYTYLRLNDGQGIHSVYNPDTLNYYGPWEMMLVAPFFNQPPYEPSNVKSMAIIGLAAGTTARQATAVFGPIPIDGYEIDPEIITVGRKYFGMTEPNLNAIAEDGRVGLEQSDRRYQIISIDAYRPPYIPPHLTTREFFQIVRDHLTGDGALAINVGRSPDGRQLIDALGSTLLSVFPSVYVVDIPNTFNSILYATVQPTQASNLVTNLVDLAREGQTHPLLIDSMKIAAAYKAPGPQKTEVFTDDRAPVEWITNAMVLRFVLTGEVEKLQ